MSGRGRLVALAALFAPGRAAPLLARLPAADAAAAAEEVARLSVAPRRERLHALATALGRGRDERRARAAAAARLERPPVAALLHRTADGVDGEDLPPVLRRLCRERIDR